MKSFEVNAPAAILNLLEEVNPNHGINPTGGRIAECMHLAKQMIAWFKQLNQEGCKPTTTWTEFIHQEKPKRTAADIKQDVLDSFKK